MNVPPDRPPPPVTVIYSLDCACVCDFFFARVATQNMSSSFRSSSFSTCSYSSCSVVVVVFPFGTGVASRRLLAKKCLSLTESPLKAV